MTRDQGEPFRRHLEEKERTYALHSVGVSLSGNRTSKHIPLASTGVLSPNQLIKFFDSVFGFFTVDFLLQNFTFNF